MQFYTCIDLLIRFCLKPLPDGTNRSPQQTGVAKFPGAGDGIFNMLVSNIGCACDATLVTLAAGLHYHSGSPQCGTCQAVDSFFASPPRQLIV